MALEPHHLHPGSKPTMLWRPSALEEAWQCKRRLGNAALYVAGGTWLRTRWEGGLQPGMPEHIISLENIAFLRTLNLRLDGSLTVGAAVRLSELLLNESVCSAFPLLRMAVSRIAAPSVRNLATAGGNVMTGTGDLMPALLASDAALMIYDGRKLDRIPVSDWIGLPDRPAELLLGGIDLPPLPEDAVPFFHKIGRREDFTPSVLTVAGWFRLDEEGKVADIRLSAGGGAMIPVRLKRAEQAGRRLEADAAAEAVYLAVEAEMPDYADDYATAGYRKRTAANLIAAELLTGERKGGKADAAES